MSRNVSINFISEKVSKIRWRPDPFNNVHSFVTGSYESYENSLKLWDFRENGEDSDVYPFTICDTQYQGDVTELKFINPDLFAVSSDTGSVNLMKICPVYPGDNDCETELKSQFEWKNIHKFPNGEPSPCTALSVYDTDIATVGEDGCINLLTSQSQDTVRKIEEADSCSIRCVTFLTHNELLTSNLRGQMKIWDLRADASEPTSTFSLSGGQVTPTCLEFHPTQRHLVVAGDEEGSLTIWDLRHNLYPVNLIDAHEDSVSEIQFHQDFPNQLFSCSAAGEIWHWNTSSTDGLLEEDNLSSVWLTTESVKNNLDVFALLSKISKPITSLDVNKAKVLCSCDNEALYFINNVNVYY